MITKIRDLLEQNGLSLGRMISPNKRSPEGHFCVFNANIITRINGKVWWGDLDLTKEGEILKKIATETGEQLYVLCEMDCRFDTENDSVHTLIKKAVWSTKNK